LDNKVFDSLAVSRHSSGVIWSSNYCALFLYLGPLDNSV